MGVDHYCTKKRVCVGKGRTGRGGEEVGRGKEEDRGEAVVGI